ncbi:hypothetical protein GDO81_014479 [Engystomops pustulosus]|uniref:Guanylate cyclase activator 2B n=1 Tax=Engystomops pustulosus TaxID=76066 RepID=A0AAV7BAU7_ENGPU|nr:hypothetical protein GDO81_014479 [Engystomops pustulosus]
MRSCLLLCVLLVWFPGSPAKKIEVGNYIYMLESVLSLKDFLHLDGRDLEVAAGEACNDPKLPEEFHEVCAEENAPDIFIQLVELAMDECEMCAHPACPGCL